jgi:hypothetical protein
MCVYCYSEPPSHILIPCFHFCLCANCAEISDNSKLKCPVCRQNITSVQRVF